MRNRPYQDHILQIVGEMFEDPLKRRLTIQLPTGAGKTHIAAQLALAMGSRRILYVVPSNEIFEQTSDKLVSVGVEHQQLKAGGRLELEGYDSLLAMSQTLSRRLRTPAFESWKPDVIFIDEIHKLIKQHRAITTKWNCPIIGLTATPVRLDGQSIADLTPYLLQTVSVSELQRQGFLVYANEFNAPAPDVKNVQMLGGDYEQGSLQRAYLDQNILKVVPDHWKLRAEGKRTITFAPGVEASKLLVQCYNRAGIRAEHVDGETPRPQRNAALERLRRHDIDVLSNVGLFVEGLDIVEVECITLCQPTKSISRYLQQVGRGLRISPATGKTRLIVIDHAGNTDLHGKVNCPRDWTNGGQYEGEGYDICRYCNAYIEKNCSKCPHCGYTALVTYAYGAAWQRAQRTKSMSTPIRACPSWASEVRSLWYRLEKERRISGHMLPDETTGIVGYVESQCRKELARTKGGTRAMNTRAA